MVETAVQANQAKPALDGRDEHVLYEVVEGIATITLNRPAQRNALSSAANARLFALWDEIDADARARVAILTSADCGTFCAGMDLKEAAQLRADTGADVLGLLKDPFYARMRSVKKPIIAAMTGHFTGGGMVLATNSDLRVGLAGTGGGISEVRHGRGSPWAVPLLWSLPQGLLMEMVLTGETVAVERLAALGFINYVEATPDAVRRRALTLARGIRDNAPLSVAAAKASLLAGMALGSEAGMARAHELHQVVYASADAQEGPRAFAEKRLPQWQGR